MLDRHAQALRDIRVDAITRQDVLRVLGPLDDRRETQQRLRHRIRAVLAWAQARGYIAGSNEAGECLTAALPTAPGRAGAPRRARPRRHTSRVRGHRRRLGYRPSASLRHLDRRTLRRSNRRTLERDRRRDTWTIPGERMKGRRSHRVALSRAAFAVLDAARGIGDGGYIFPSPVRKGQPVTGQGLREALRCAGLAATVHGFRSSFRSWCAETGQRWDAAEMCLAHHIGNAVERSYQRSDLLAERRSILEAWGAYCTS